MPELSEIRNPLNTENVGNYLAKLPESAILGKCVPDFVAPFTAKQFTFGQSNPTYLIVGGDGRKYVLRRKPMANAKLVSKSAHAIEREFYMLNGITLCNDSALDAKKVPVPQVYVLCEDESVTGAVFYIMEYILGRPIKRPDMPKVPDHQKNMYWSSIMETISAIHLVDCKKLLEYLPEQHFPQFKKPAQPDPPTYFQRQIKTLSAVQASQAQVVKPIPDFERICKWILERAPRDPDQVTLVHGDCKIDNFLFHESEPRVVAVLDWELCTLGHPMFDLANFLQMYVFSSGMNQMMFPDTEIGSDNIESVRFLRWALELYQRKFGHEWRENDPKNNPIDLWRMGSVFGLLRICVISQGVAMRSKNGTASSASADFVGGLYFPLSELAVELMKEPSKL